MRGGRGGGRRGVEVEVEKKKTKEEEETASEGRETVKVGGERSGVGV